VLNYAPRNEDVLGDGGIAPLILNLVSLWKIGDTSEFLVVNVML